MSGALAVALAGASATVAFAQTAPENGDAPSTDRSQMMGGTGHGQMMEPGQMMEGMEHGQMGGMDHGQHASETGQASTATEAYRAASAAMHTAMDIDLTGDADVDFARGMIAHHVGAIDMANVLLEHGDDPELRELAEAIIAAQEAEVAFLEAWLAEHAE
ncbi:CopM family metallochaperone [Citreimonas salinaria]|uniref:CopM family metallochaperone n=1 Tax=Citreimonas salinaria TaxID=321339 RepID=UPI001FE1A73D|nr:DUF305 domain-containing protein [Citreimonas salinaria]